MRMSFNRGRYANVTSTLALVVALGGTSYAAVTITGSNIKNGSVKRVDLGSNAVTSAKVKDGSLLRKDFKAGELPAGAQGTQGAPGANGANGAPGAPGTNGTNGAPGATNVTTRILTQSMAVGESDLTVPCLAGERAVGGGGNIPPNDPEVTIVASNPFPATNGSTPTGWTMRFKVTGVPHDVTASVVCARP